MKYICKIILVAACILCVLPLSSCAENKGYYVEPLPNCEIHYAPTMPTKPAHDPCKDFDASDGTDTENSNLLMKCMIHNYDTMKLREQEEIQYQKEMAAQRLEEQRSKFEPFKKDDFLENNKAMSKMIMNHIKASQQGQ